MRQQYDGHISIEVLQVWADVRDLYLSRRGICTLHVAASTQYVFAYYHQRHQLFCNDDERVRHAALR